MRLFRTLALVACSMLLVLAAPRTSDAGRPTRGGLMMTPDAVVPGPGELGSSAQATVKVSRDEVCFAVDAINLGGFIQTIGIYQAPVGQAGPMVVRLSPSSIGINQSRGCVAVSGPLAKAIGRNPSAYYIEIRSTTCPNGALRAQLGR
jgi:hypothetical protein